MSDTPTIKVFSLTDVSTPALKAAGMENAVVAVHNRLLNPGEMIEVPDDPHVRHCLQGYVHHGAAAVDQLPPGYVIAKAKLEAEKSAVAASRTALPEEAPTPTKRTGKRGQDE
jgi:hypothetical protein